MLKKIIILFLYSFLFGSISEPFNLQIIATTNNNGEIEPCGWKKKPLGGLARKATIVDSKKEQYENLLVLDAGNLFFKKSKLTEVEQEALKVNAKIIRDSYNIIGCNAFNLGEKDFAAGLEFLLELKEKSNFPYISSNIFSNDGKQIFDSYKIMDFQNVEIAIIGLTSTFNHPDIQIKDPISILDNVLKEISSKHNTDINILLFHSNAADMKKLHLHDLEIDFILQSKDHKLASDGGSELIPVFACGSRGKYVYNFDLNFTESNVNFVDLSKFENKISLSNKKLKRLKKGNFDASLEEIYSNDPAKLEQIKKLQKTIIDSEKKLKDNKNTITFEKIELNKKIADRPDILKIVDDGKIIINEILGPQPAIPFNSHDHHHDHHHHSHPHVSPRGGN